MRNILDTCDCCGYTQDGKLNGYADSKKNPDSRDFFTLGVIFDTGIRESLYMQYGSGCSTKSSKIVHWCKDCMVKQGIIDVDGKTEPIVQEATVEDLIRKIAREEMENPL